MFGIILLLLGSLDAEKYKRIAGFFLLLGSMEARLIERHTIAYSLFGMLLLGRLHTFGECMYVSGLYDKIVCGELRLYAICPGMWYRHMSRKRIYDEDTIIDIVA